MIVRNANSLIKNARTSALNHARRILVEVVDSAIRAGDPVSSVQKWIKLDPDRLKIADCEVDLAKVGKIVVVGGGKAGVAMAIAIEQLLDGWLSEGIVNIPEGTSPVAYNGKIKFIEVRHPIPSEAGVVGAREMLSLVQKLGEHDLVIFVLSGGGSAIIPLPADGITLAQLQETTRLLLNSGATINELNIVRKHLSAVKGGQLARAAYPARIVTLLISDVVGDGLDTIASGPTYWDSTTFSDAIAVLERYDLTDKVPAEVLCHLRDGVKWLIPDTPNRGDICFRNACYQIIMSNIEALEAAEKTGKSHDLNVEILTTKLKGNAREVGQNLPYIAEEVIKSGKQLPCLLLLGGETTVQVTGRGIGGRNQEIALSAVPGLAKLKNVAMISFSTDGIDGPTDAAGAIVDGYTLQRAEELGLDPSTYLADNDSYHFFAELEDLVLTGATGTNIVDCIALLIL
jgi:glycerate 2-kinase